MIAYFDCFSGISGDMTLGALLDAGANRSLLDQAVLELGLAGEVEIHVRHEERGHLGGTRVVVESRPGPARALPELDAAVRGARLPERVRRRSLEALRRLAEAESAVHGLPIAEVHLHELGGADTLVDLVGAFWLLESMDVSAVNASPLPAPRGFDGQLPMPAPATMRLLAGSGAVLEPVEGAPELVTPTGAAILVAAPARFERPSLRLERIGYGIGGRDRPGNALAVWLGEPSLAGSEVAVLETNLDDMAPNRLAALVEDLFEEGALDVSLAPALMKKGRPGQLLTVLAEPADGERLARRLLTRSTTLGVRMSRSGRLVAQRRLISVETGLGSVRVKVKEVEGRVVGLAPEYEDCRGLSRATGAALQDVMRMAEEAGWKQVGGA